MARNNKTYSVYILSNASKTLYVGVTSNLASRTSQHQALKPGSFTSKYHIWKLVYTEQFANVYEAILREKQIKKWRREKKLELIRRSNPTFAEIPTF